MPPEQLSVPTRLALPQLAGYLAVIAANWIASIVVLRVQRQAHRGLATLNDRTLEDMGLARPELMSLLEALTETRTAAASCPGIVCAWARDAT
jgi:uncharacterized protein YjiS (DUF1127 family)